ncbi:MAG: ferrochelatase [Rhodospirillales bacterium]
MRATTSYPEKHPTIPEAKIGILLLNLGTPNATDYWSMRRYLSEFLSDRRIIELSPALWQPILQGIILSIRPKKSGAAYARIWNKEKNESPLRTTTRDLTEKVASIIRPAHPNIIVDFAMRYGDPSTASVIERMIKEGCDRLLLLPLYPQYSAATSGTACDQAFRQLMRERWQPAIRTTPPWYDDPNHIDLLAESIERHYNKLDWTPDLLVTSFHGLPMEYFEKGDPYHCHCAKTARMLRERLGWEKEKLLMVFQSRFGPKEWLQPYADETVKSLPAKGIKKIAVISPGFVADCVETLDELAIELAHGFHAAGGENFTYIPCLNDDDGHAAYIANLATRELSGWI